ncbi:hypothetical protein P3T76_007055 [Phytophthora citrophthora]|uniref:Uncharacterized protein n=1 Tax=Phytophthora citrophthora TaxID=4793 RepID=A0AAD9GLW0_9STRA|nr:hypothetical protein P3T76_007055 [Phytophthora citrophthora]
MELSAADSACFPGLRDAFFQAYDAMLGSYSDKSLPRVQDTDGGRRRRQSETQTVNGQEEDR